MGIVKDTRIYKLLKEASIELNGQLSYYYQKCNGGMISGGLYNFEIGMMWNGLEISITTSLDELPLQKDEFNRCEISISATKSSPFEVELSLWRKDYFDKIFGRKAYKTGYKEFDKVIAVKPSRNIEGNIRKAFESQALRNELIMDKCRTYHICSENEKVIVQRKSALRMENKEMIVSEFQRFERFLNGLKEASVI